MNVKLALLALFFVLMIQSTVQLRKCRYQYSGSYRYYRCYNLSSKRVRGRVVKYWRLISTKKIRRKYCRNVYTLNYRRMTCYYLSAYKQCSRFGKKRICTLRWGWRYWYRRNYRRTGYRCANVFVNNQGYYYYRCYRGSRLVRNYKRKPYKFCSYYYTKKRRMRYCANRLFRYKCYKWGWKKANKRCYYSSVYQIYYRKWYKRRRYCESKYYSKYRTYRCYKLYGNSYRVYYKRKYPYSGGCSRFYKNAYFQKYCYKYKKYRYCRKYTRYGKKYYYCGMTNGLIITSRSKWTRRKGRFCYWYYTSSYRYLRCQYWSGTRLVTYKNKRYNQYKGCSYLTNGRTRIRFCYRYRGYNRCYRYGYKKRYRRCYNTHKMYVYYIKRQRNTGAYCQWTANSSYRYYNCYRYRSGRWQRYYHRRYSLPKGCTTRYYGRYKYRVCYKYAFRRYCYNYNNDSRLKRCYNSGYYKAYYFKKSLRSYYCIKTLSRKSMFESCYNRKGGKSVLAYKKRSPKTFCRKYRYGSTVMTSCYTYYLYKRCFGLYGRRVCTTTVSYYLSSRKRRIVNRYCRKFFSGIYQYKYCYVRKTGKYCWKWYNVRLCDNRTRFKLVSKNVKQRYYCRWSLTKRYKTRLCYVMRRYKKCRRYGTYGFYRTCSWIYKYKLYYRKRYSRRVQRYCRWKYVGSFKYRLCWRYSRYRVCRKIRRRKKCQFKRGYRLYYKKRYRRKKYCKWVFKGAFKFYICLALKRIKFCYRVKKIKKCKFKLGYKVYFKKEYRRTRYCSWLRRGAYKYRLCYVYRKRRICRKVRKGKKVTRKCSFKYGYKIFSRRRYRRNSFCRWWRTGAYKYRLCYKLRVKKYCRKYRRRKRCWRRYSYKLTKKRKYRRNRFCRSTYRRSLRFLKCYKLVKVCRKLRRGKKVYKRCRKIYRIYVNRTIKRKYYCANSYVLRYQYRRCYRVRYYRRCYGRGKRRRCYSRARSTIVFFKRYLRRKWCKFTRRGRYRYYRCYALKFKRRCRVYRRLFRRYRRCRVYRSYKLYRKFRRTRRKYCKWTANKKFKFYRCYRIVRYKKCRKYKRGKRVLRKCKFLIRYKRYYSRKYKRRKRRFCKVRNYGAWRYRFCYALKRVRRCRRYRRRRICRTGLGYKLVSRKRSRRSRFCRNTYRGRNRYYSCYRILKKKLCRKVKKKRVCRNIFRYKRYKFKKYLRKKYCVSRNRGSLRYVKCFRYRNYRRCRRYRIGRRRVRRCRRFKGYVMYYNRRFRLRRYCKWFNRGAFRYVNCFRLARRYRRCYGGRRRWLRRVGRKCVWRYKYRVYYRRKYRLKRYCRKYYRGATRSIVCYRYKRYKVCRVLKNKKKRCIFRYRYKVYRRKTFRRKKYCSFSNRNQYRFLTCRKLVRVVRKCRRSGGKLKCFKYYKYRVYLRKRMLRSYYCKKFRKGAFRYLRCYKFGRIRKCRRRFLRRKCSVRTGFSLVKNVRARLSRFCKNVYRGRFRYLTCYKYVNRKYKAYLNKRLRRLRYCSSRRSGKFVLTTCYRLRVSNVCKTIKKKRKCFSSYKYVVVGRRRRFYRGKNKRTKRKYVYRWRRTCRRFRRGRKSFVRCYKYRVRFICTMRAKRRRCVRDRRYKGRYILIKKKVGGKFKLVCQCKRVKH